MRGHIVGYRRGDDVRRRPLRVLRRVVVAPRNSRDLDDREGFHPLRVAPDGDGQFPAADELLDEQRLIVAEGVRQRSGKLFLLLDDGDADARSLRRSLDDDGQGERLEDTRGKRRILLEAVEGLRTRRRHSRPQEDALRHDLVHRNGSGEHARPRIGDAEHVERSLQHAVLAVLAVQRVEDDGAAARPYGLSETRRVELHALDLVSFRFESADDGGSRAARNLGLARRPAHDDDDLSLLHELTSPPKERPIPRPSSIYRPRPS